MDHEVRGRIYQLIVSFPGIHFRKIMREYSKDETSIIQTGALTYHLDILLKNRFVKSSRDGYKKRFYCSGQQINNSFQNQILDKIKNHYEKNRIGITKKELIIEFDVSEKIIRYNLDKIEKHIQKSRDGRQYRYSPLK